VATAKEIRIIVMQAFMIYESFKTTATVFFLLKYPKLITTLSLTLTPKHNHPNFKSNINFNP
jgi:hypothetical protein